MSSKTEKITAFWTNAMLALHSIGVVVLYSVPFLVIFGAIPRIPGANFISAAGSILLKLVAIIWDLWTSAFWLSLIQVVVPVTPLAMSAIWTAAFDAESASQESQPSTESTHEHAVSSDGPVNSSDWEVSEEPPPPPKGDSMTKAVILAFLRLACAIWVINQLKPLALDLIGLVTNSTIAASKLLTKTIIVYVLIYVFAPISPLMVWVAGPIAYQRIRSRSAPVNV